MKHFPQKIAGLEQRIVGFTADIEHAEACTTPNEDGFSPMEIKGKAYTEKKEAGEAILDACKAMTSPDPIQIGTYRGFAMELSFDTFGREYHLTLKNNLSHLAVLGTDPLGNIQRIDNAIKAMPERMKSCRLQLENEKQQLENAKVEVEKPFPHEEELTKKTARLAELNALLDMDKRDNEIVDGGIDEAEAERNTPVRTGQGAR